jgi:hypothetical protein
MSENTIAHVSKDVINGVLNLASSNNVMVLRVNKERIEKRLPILEKTLEDLKISDQRNRSDIDKAVSAINAENQAGTNVTIEPIQATSFYSLDINGPEQSVHHNMSQVLDKYPGLRALSKESDRINYYISYYMSVIRNYKQEYEKITAILNANTQKNSGVKSSDIETDRLERSVYSSALYLYLLAQQYRKFTTNGKTRGYPDNDLKLTRDLLLIRDTFKAHALSFPDIYPSLNLLDPGDDATIKILAAYVEQIRSAVSLDVVPIEAKVKKYMDNLNATMQSPTASKGIIKRSIPGAPSENSMATATKTYSNFHVNFLGGLYPIDFQIPSLLDSAKKLLQKKISRTYEGLPPCNPIVFTPADTKQQAINNQQAKNEATASKTFNDNLAKTPTTATQPPKGVTWYDYFNDHYYGETLGAIPPQYFNTSILQQTSNYYWVTAGYSATSIAEATSNEASLGYKSTKMETHSETVIPGSNPPVSNFAYYVLRGSNQ